MWGCIFSQLCRRPMAKLDARFHHIMSTQIPLDIHVGVCACFDSSYLEQLYADMY
jgi:hypothetical protein